MIENVWVLTKDGTLLYEKNYVKLKTEADLLAGFLSAMDSFATEATQQQIKGITMKDKKFSYTIAKEDNLIFVLSTVESDNDVLIKKLLKEIQIRFSLKYKKKIAYFAGNVSVFNDFNDDLEKIILNSDISINCQTCKKIIQGEYIEKQLGDTTFYFCCEMCEKYFKYDEHIEEKKRLQIEEMQLICQDCEYKKPLPKHCNRPMHHEIVDGKEKLICWMGPECGIIDIPTHCGRPMKII
jgi:hypothetical protein